MLWGRAKFLLESELKCNFSIKSKNSKLQCQQKTVSFFSKEKKTKFYHFVLSKLLFFLFLFFFSNTLLTIKQHGLEPAEEREKRRDSLVAVEDELRLLGDLPHPHRAVPPSRRHAALAAQTVQARDGGLMAEAAERLGERTAPRSLNQLLQLETLTEFPRRHFHPRSTLWPSGRETRCKGRESPSWTRDPARGADVWRAWSGAAALNRSHRGVWRSYRHGAFVSGEFVQAFARLCLPYHDEFVHVSSGLEGCSDASLIHSSDLYISALQATHLILK